MKTIKAQPVDVPPAKVIRQGPEHPDVIVPPDPPCHDASRGAFWPVYVADGEPVHPAEAAECIEHGLARLEDTEAAGECILRLSRVFESPGLTLAAYSAPISEQHRRDRAALVAEVRALIGIPEGDDVPPGFVPPLLSKAEVSKLFGVSESTIDRRAGQSLPAPLRITGRPMWKSDAILRLLES